MAANIKMTYSKEVSQREKENMEVAYKVAIEGMVLLENDGTLPIKPQHVALFGAGAAMDFKGGTGSGEVNERHTIGIKEGLLDAGFTTSTDSWLAAYVEEAKAAKAEHDKNNKMDINPFDMQAEKMINIMSNALVYPYGRKLTKEDLEGSNSKICLYVISRQAGECYDKKLERGDLDLSPREIENLKIAREYYEKLIVIINIGGIINLTPLDEIGVNAILQFGQQGMTGGRALADILTGAAVPSGHLTDTWIASYDQVPYGMEFSYIDGDTLHAEYKEGIYVGYRYYDSFGVEPRYPFGYGLSYTTFDIKPGEVSIGGSVVTVKATVKNTGDTYSGKESVQVYVSCPEGKLEREAQSLAGYAKTGIIAPGASEEVSVTFDMKTLAAYEEASAQYLLEAGGYIVRVGDSSRNTSVAGVIDVEDEIVVSKCTNVAPNPRKATMKELKREGAKLLSEIPADAKHIKLAADAITTIVYSYLKPQRKSSPEIDKILGSLTMKEKAHLVCGTGVMDMMGGNKLFDAPGAAAFTTSELVRKGLANATLADGPAGLRLTRTCGINKKGQVKQAEALMAMMDDQGDSLMGKLMNKFMYADLTKDTPVYQFATAFPVGTSVAQTWNQPLIEEMGYAVGREMEEYGITFWLAPGMNIHRNPLCGRNYEYFSEDPLIAGKTAAAISRGVQKHDGCYVTIKHYCCNNQEFDRCTMSAYVNERPLREIYLKGFEISVREGNSLGVMTSYNMTNEQYSAASYDFCMKLMRNEWGFDGVIMTDWFASWPGLADPANGIKGGNDLHMPGGKQSWNPILKAVKAGTLKEEELDWCCANIIDAVLKSNIQKEYIK